jgi:hypothetical protein
MRRDQTSGAYVIALASALLHSAALKVRSGHLQAITGIAIFLKDTAKWRVLRNWIAVRE